MLAAYGRDGAAALVSKKRGKRSNRAYTDAVKTAALALARERYQGFGPTLLAEKLAELHGLVLSRETLRQWLMQADLWRSRQQRQAAVHQPRYRRDCLGELIHIVLEPTELAKGLRRNRVRVYDYPDGTVAIKYQRVDLPYRVFDKVRDVESADIASNKRLGARHCSLPKTSNASIRSHAAPAPRRGADSSGWLKNAAVKPIPPSCKDCPNCPNCPARERKPPEPEDDPRADPLGA